MAAKKKAAKKKKKAAKKKKATKKAKPEDKRLTVKEKLFVAAYCVHMNAASAAKEAGYEISEGSKTSFRQIGYITKNRPHIAKAIRKNVAARLDALNCRAEDVLRELTYIAFGQVTDVVAIEEIDPDSIESGLPESLCVMLEDGLLEPWEPSDDLLPSCKAYRVNILDTEYWGRAQRAAVNAIEVDKTGNIKIKFADKQKALDTLTKYFNMIKPEAAAAVDGAGVIMVVPSTVESFEEWEKKTQEAIKRSKQRSKDLLNKK